MLRITIWGRRGPAPWLVAAALVASVAAPPAIASTEHVARLASLSRPVSVARLVSVTTASTKDIHPSRFIVGDSLTLGASSGLKRQSFKVNAKVGRQFSAAPAVLRKYHSLSRNVVIALGTNGTVTLGTCRKVVRIAGKHRRVFLVNNRVHRSWQNSNNRTLRACDKSFASSRVRLVDWHDVSAGHPSWIGPDGVHHTSKGRAAYIRTIDKAVDRYGL